jgi:parallel beta-helix repeat protein
MIAGLIMMSIAGSVLVPSTFMPPFAPEKVSASPLSSMQPRQQEQDSQSSSFSPSCGSTIIRSITLASDIGPCSKAGLTISSDNVVLNCNGHTISGNGLLDGTTFGISVSRGHSGIVVSNCKVTGFSSGFSINNYSTGNTLNNNRSTNNAVGIVVYNATNNMLTGNLAANNSIGGFSFFSATNNTLNNNTSTNNSGSGFLMYNATNNTLNNNKSTNNTYDGFYISPRAHDNLIQFNIANSNEYYGYLDDSPATATAQTSNKYDGNKCADNNVRGSSPAGLCDPQE